MRGCFPGPVDLLSLGHDSLTNFLVDLRWLLFVSEIEIGVGDVGGIFLVLVPGFDGFGKFAGLEGFDAIVFYLMGHFILFNKLPSL